MGFSAAVQWWEDWQLRLLVLASLFFQYFLFAAAIVRKRRIPHWFRALIWLAYQGGDVVAVYALATLFIRHKAEAQALATNPATAHLQMLWAPILLLHLGGQDGITAYSIEDNENWRRHLLVSVSQIIVAIYVFRKSWWSGDIVLRRAAILLFIPGILKCLEKPRALKNATVASIMNSSDSQLEATLDEDDKPQKHKDIYSQEEYVQAAAESVANPVELSVDEVADEPYHLHLHLFVDLGHPYSIRLRNLRRLVAPSSTKDKDDDDVHGMVRSSLSKAFDRLYTKHKASFAGLLRAAVALVTFVVIGLFQRRHRGVYDRADVVVTNVLLGCTATLELVSACLVLGSGLPPPDDRLSQYNLFGYLARNEKHPWFWALAHLLGARVLLDRLWCTAPPAPSLAVTRLVYDHVTDGWKDYIGKSVRESKMTSDAADYRRFNDSRGQQTLQMKGCAIEESQQQTPETEGCDIKERQQQTPETEECDIRETQQQTLETKGCRLRIPKAIQESLRMPFDESVLLWHLATEFCYFDHVGTGNNASRHSRMVSNYMAYLLFVKPEMLIPGARSRLFWATYNRLRKMLKPPPVDEELEPTKKKSPPPRSENEMVREVIQKVKSTIGLGSENVVHKAWAVASELKEFAREKEKEFVKEHVDREKRTKLIVEVLCRAKVAADGFISLTRNDDDGKDQLLMKAMEDAKVEAEGFIKEVENKEQTNEEKQIMYLLECARKKAEEFIKDKDKEKKAEGNRNEEKKEQECSNPNPEEEGKRAKEKKEQEKKKLKEFSNNVEKVSTEIAKQDQKLKDLMRRNLITNEQELLTIRSREDADDKMWSVIQGVWVEMLCFSAGRCRGYLHAKSLGSGGEYLSYVWLLLYYMGMETMPERMQRPELPTVGDTGALVKTPTDDDDMDNPVVDGIV